MDRRAADAAWVRRITGWTIAGSLLGALGFSGLAAWSHPGSDSSSTASSSSVTSASAAVGSADTTTSSDDSGSSWFDEDSVRQDQGGGFDGGRSGGS